MVSMRPAPGYLLFKNIHATLLVVASVMLLILVGLLNFINTGSIFPGYSLLQLMREVWLIFIQLLVILYFLYYSLLFFDKYFSKLRLIPRLLLEILLVTSFGFIINRVFLYLFVTWIVVPEENMQELNAKIQRLIIMIQTLLTVMYSLVSAGRLWGRLQQTSIENKRLEREITVARFEALKNQLNPHFLFNSLSVLLSLMQENAQKAELFIERLSKIYRYMLENKVKEPVLFQTELEYLDHYLYMYRLRYFNKAGIMLHLGNTATGRFILPQTLFIVLEYITESSRMSATLPLEITLSSDMEFLIVSARSPEKLSVPRQLKEQLELLKINYSELGFPITVTKEEAAGRTIYKIPFLRSSTVYAD